jgi:ATP-dependent helicase YprA (DUF1998 family)
MPAVQSRLDSHQRDAAKAAAILQKAREEARKSRNYQSAPTRAKIRNEFRERNNGMTAHEWQVDMGEALHLGLDCSMIAGTGAGKTMPFVMPLFVDSDKMIIIISPLNALEEDQASGFRHATTCIYASFVSGFAVSKDGALCCRGEWGNLQ